mgnify:CR=1 FL=1
MDEPILKVEDLQTYFFTQSGIVKAVDGISFELKPGETLRSRDVTLDMPACDANGDFLVLKNLFEDLKVAAN